MLEKIFIISFMVMAIWATMWEGMIFGFIRKWGEDNLPEKIQMMLFSCPVCMVPYYGTPIFFWLLEGGNIKSWIVIIVSAMGVNAVLIKMFPKEEVDFNLKNN